MSKPNLLFIFTDEQRADTMAAYGNTRIQTPVLNRLAGHATVFDNCYVSQSVCTPSRSTIMTGLYPHTNGCTENNIPLDERIPCLSEMIGDSDYAKAYHGKWHLGDEIFAQHGFDDWAGVEDMYSRFYRETRDRQARSAYHHWLVSKGQTPSEGNIFHRGHTARFPEELSKPAFLAKTASRFIRDNRDNPFILYVNFLEPHMPFFGPRDDQYPLDQIELPPNFEHALADGTPLKARLLRENYYRHGHSGLPLKTEADWRRMIANYWGLCSLVDTHVGTILSTLEDCGLYDNTIVVYTSDHGDMMGSHRLLAKTVNYEEALRVPLLVKMPNQKQGRRVGGRISQIDLVPTLLECLGQPVPSSLQGTSRRDTLDDPSRDTIDEDVFVEWNGANNGLREVLRGVDVPEWMTEIAPRDKIERSMSDPTRTVITPEGWKFNCSPAGEHELYNLDQDPLETTNLATDPRYRDLMKDLQEKIVDWQERTEDDVKLPVL